MENQTDECVNQNIWADRTMLPQVSTKYRVLAAVACFLCALAIPLCSSEPISLVILGLLFVYVALMTRTPLPIVLTLSTAFLAVTLASNFNVGFGGGAVVLSLIVGTASCTWLITTMRLPILAILLPVLAGGVSYLWISDLRICLLALSFLPASLLLAYATLRSKTRASAICYGVVGLLISALILLGVIIWQECGSLSRDVIMTWVTNLREGLIADFIAAREDVLRIALEEGIDQNSTWVKLLTETLNDEAVRKTVEQTFYLMPAMAVVFCSVVAFEAQMLLNCFYRTAGLGVVLTKEATFFTMSLTSAILYSITFLLRIFLPVTSLAGATVQNISMILMPGLCVVGVIATLPMLARSNGSAKTFLLLMLAFMICCYPGGALYILAMWGAYTVVTHYLRTKMIQKMKENGVDPDEFNDRDDRDNQDPDQ